MTVSSIAASSNHGRVQAAIAQAASRTGVDFNYLLGQAKVESGLNANARAGTSSATGLYQFIEQSWLAVVKKHGATHGLGWAADAIGQSGGRMTVTDGATRSAILNLRNNPEIASLMAAEHASDNADALQGTLGRTANGTDLYMAHFLGLGGAKQFLSAMQANPDRPAAAMFPGAARANRNVFFERDGSARSLSQVYERFAGKLGDGAASAVSPAVAGKNLPAMQFAAQALQMDGDTTVITGNGQSAHDAMSWAHSTLGRIESAQANAASLLRPSPDNARLAYMMLASMGA
jgi:hypothetical protein